MARRHGRFDPPTGKVVEYPMLYTDNGMRDFFLDKAGRFWCLACRPTTASAIFTSPPKRRNAR